MRFTILFILFILIGCSDNNDRKKQLTKEYLNEQKLIDSTANSTKETKTKITKLSTMDSLVLKADTSEWHFHTEFKNTNNESINFFSGYIEYDEDKYGFQNPAYLKIFIEDTLVFEESFKAYERHWIEPFRNHEFSDGIDFYKLYYGLEAHDYIVTERLMSINNHSVQVVGEFDFQATTFASNYKEYIFPSDSGGLTNMLIIVDKIDYRTKEEPNIADTTFYEYVNGEFKKKR